MIMLSKYENRVHIRLVEDANIILKYFLTYKFTPFEIAEFTGIAKETVINILNDKKLIKEIYPNNPDILTNIVEILAYQNRIVKLCFLPMVLDLFKEEEKWHFLAMLILTFRLHLNEVAEDLKMDAEELYETLEKYNPNLKSSFNYLFNGDKYPQDIANIRLISFISEYYTAYQNKDKKRMQELAKYIYDGEYNELLSNYHQEQLTNEQLIILINRQIKYGLRVSDIVSPLNISKTKYLDPVKFFTTDKKNLQEQLANLSYYNKNLARINRGKHE